MSEVRFGLLRIGAVCLALVGLVLMTAFLWVTWPPALLGTYGAATLALSWLAWRHSTPQADQ